MPTELEELVEFLHHGNTNIRQLAAENLVPFSEHDPSIFKASQYLPIKDLKLLVKDYPPIAKNAITMLVNLSGEKEVLKLLWEDEAFLEAILLRITNPKEPNADLLAMLLANMAKDDRIQRLLTLKRTTPKSFPTSSLAIDQLLDVFVRSADGAFNSAANLDYLAYLLADLAKFPPGASYFLSKQPYDDIYPLSKLLPFFSHSSMIRRQGVGAATKNTAFAKVDAHPELLNPPLDVLPFVLRPLASGKDEYKPEEEEQLPEELQLLDESCQREEDHLILRTHLDTLLLLTSSREGRDELRGKGVYYVIRECHLAVEDDEVREGCDRLVQVLMRDEEGEETPMPKDALAAGSAPGKMLTQQKEETKKQVESEDEDDKVVEIAL